MRAKVMKSVQGGVEVAAAMRAQEVTRMQRGCCSCCNACSRGHMNAREVAVAVAMRAQEVTRMQEELL